MKRILIVFCALSLVALIAMPALAEVQNIKVSGEISIKGFYRDNYATTGSGGGRVLTGFADTDARDWYNSVTKLGIDADLTDNVTANVLLANEQDWPASTNVVNVYVSSITMKEMLYSPLTIKAGKMAVQIADGLIIGDGTTNEATLGSDYAASRAFYTVHGILDYDPLTLIVGTLKIAEAPQTTTDDVDGYLIDAIYKFDSYNAVLDTYLVNAHYGSPQTVSGPTAASTKAVDVIALATRLTMEPVEKLSTDLGIALQMGDYEKTATTSRDLKAMALNLGAQYALDTEYSPKVGVKYIYRSGQNAGVTTGDYKGWLALFENQKNGIILDPNTNTSSVALTASIVPMDKLTLALDLWFYQLAKKQDATATRTDKREAGTEIDILLKYAYTEDVNLGLSLGYFMPGGYYAEGNDKAAKQVLAEVGVKF